MFFFLIYPAPVSFYNTPPQAFPVVLLFLRLHSLLLAHHFLLAIVRYLWWLFPATCDNLFKDFRNTALLSSLAFQPRKFKGFVMPGRTKTVKKMQCNLITEMNFSICTKPNATLFYLAVFKHIQSIFQNRDINQCSEENPPPEHAFIFLSELCTEVSVHHTEAHFAHLQWTRESQQR